MSTTSEALFATLEERLKNTIEDNVRLVAQLDAAKVELVDLRADREQAAKVAEQLRLELEAEHKWGLALQAELGETKRVATEEIGKRDDWNVELLGVIRLALDTAEHAQLNVKALTGGDERRLTVLINACRAELQEDDKEEPLVSILSADYERLLASIPRTEPTRLAVVPRLVCLAQIINRTTGKHSFCSREQGHEGLHEAKP